MVYILEDDTSILELVGYALKSQDIESQGFSEVDKFFDALKIKVPQVVILDVMLPGISGFEILEKIKTNPKTKNISTILWEKRIMKRLESTSCLIPLMIGHKTLLKRLWQGINTVFFRSLFGL